MNSNCLLAFTEVMTHDGMRQSYHSVPISTEAGTTGSGTVEFFFLNEHELEYLTEFYLFQALTWQLTMLQIYVTLWGRCLCVCVSECQST